MGDWMTVTVEGSIDPADAAAARAFIDVGRMEDGWDRFHCLCYYGQSLAGLGRWIPEGGGKFSAVGNLSERNYGTDDVADVLGQLLAVAPSLRVKVHCGGSYESTDCVATVTAADGTVTVGEPEIAHVGAGLQGLAEARFKAILGIREEH